MMRKSVPDLLRDAAALYEQRNQQYGDAYKRIGPIMMQLLSGGIVLKSADDFNRMAIFTLIVIKLARYAQNFSDNGHTDSLDDLSVYSQMLQELDQAERAK
jgi:hypothetical protein